MNKPSDEIERQATDTDMSDCRNCSHPWKNHITPWGTQMTCDETVERNIVTPGFAEMDVECFCRCDDYEPMTAEDYLEKEGKI